MAQDSSKTNAQQPAKESKTWQEARMQPRVRPQWDPKEKANELLDAMDREGRLFRRSDRT